MLLDELYSLAKRLDARMETVERLVAQDDPGFVPRLVKDYDADFDRLAELDRLVAEKKGLPR